MGWVTNARLLHSNAACRGCTQACRHHALQPHAAGDASSIQAGSRAPVTRARLCASSWKVRRNSCHPMTIGALACIMCVLTQAQQSGHGQALSGCKAQRRVKPHAVHVAAAFGPRKRAAPHPRQSLACHEPSGLKQPAVHASTCRSLATGTMASLCWSMTVMNTLPLVGSFCPAAMAALAYALLYSMSMPITSPVDRISGPSSVSAPAAGRPQAGTLRPAERPMQRVHLVLELSGPAMVTPPPEEAVPAPTGPQLAGIVATQLCLVCVIHAACFGCLLCERAL